MFQKPDKSYDLFKSLKHNGTWFKIVLVIGILIRIYLAIFTEGTYDVEIWKHHVTEINRIGLIEYYKASYGGVRPYNHPPVIGNIMASIFYLSAVAHIPFKIVFRLFFTSLDFVIAFYLLKILIVNPYRYLFVAAYLLNPITFILSAYHGNVDSSLGLFIIMTIYYLSQKKHRTAGLIFGAGACIKWIVFLAAPALLFAIPGLKKKVRFITYIAFVCLLGYFPVLIKDPNALINSVFKYGGQMIQTVAGIPVWGNRILYTEFVMSYLKVFNFPTSEIFFRWICWYLDHNSVIILITVIMYAWLRRHRGSAAGMCKTTAETFCIFYALTNFWSFQHFAWAAPFWIFLGPVLFLAVSFCISGYIYLLYSLVCGSFLLLGRWDFVGHPYLSVPVLLFRDISILLFTICGIYFFLSALPGHKDNKKEEITGIC